MNNALETAMKSRLASKGHKLEVHEGRLQEHVARQLRSVEENTLLDHRERGLDKTLADSFRAATLFFNTESNAEKLSTRNHTTGALASDHASYRRKMWQLKCTALSAILILQWSL